ncbi:hypothetical protein ACHAXR_001724 [Thalassiosira sp. AJA248-18]
MSNMSTPLSPNKSTPPSPRYLTILCEFMAFFHKKPKPYPKEHEFAKDELDAITPNDVVKFMNVKHEKGSGCSSLEFMKKAISFYMPNKENWDAEQKHGNPTRSQEVKAFMQRVVASGGSKKKNGLDNNAFPVVPSDGPSGMLQRMQDQNNDFINILNTMGSALRTFSRSVEQMKSALETNNIAIRTELEEGAGDGGDEDAAAVAPENETAVPELAPVLDFPAIDAEMKEDVAQVAETLQDFMNTNIVTNRDMRIQSGADGFCTFSCSRTGKKMDVPDGFELPSCDLLRAWRYWITGFPDFKVRNDNDEIVDSPIRPLRLVNTTDLPQSLKKKFKDGYRPILLSMQGDVAKMLESTPVAAMDDKFVQDSYNMAMSALVQKAPGIFAESSSEKCSQWKVATWSRKIRENHLGQQQVRRRQEQLSSAALKTGEQQQKQEQQPPPSPQPPSLPSPAAEI